MCNVHIVIPVYNNYPLLHELLWKLQKIEAKNITDIYLINDCSTDDEVVGGLKWWSSSYGSKFPIYFINNSENLGFLKTSNYGMQMVAGFDSTKDTDIIILLSTDVNVSYPFVQQIKDHIEYNPESLVGGVLHSHDTGWNKFGDRLFPYLEGWLLATQVRTWNALEFFDEQFAPSDYEDVDLSTLAVKYGYQLAPLNNPGIFHLGGRSIGYNEERLQRTKINQKKFEEKWIK